MLVRRKQWKISISNVVLLRLGIFFLFYVVYIGLGAVIFWALEGPSECVAAIHLFEVRQAILGKNPAIEKDLEEFENALKKANSIGKYVISNETYKTNWSLGNSVFFVGTLLTTIGYGNITPQTAAGKVFTIVFATIGIPMTLLLLSAFVEKMLVIAMSFLLWLDSKLHRFYSSLLIRLIHLGIVLIVMTVGFLVVPALIISLTESQWDVLDAFYYCFTSLTTIGLGDFIPGDSLNQPNRDLYKIAVTCYLYAGCTAMMLVMAIIYDIPEIKISHYLSNMNENTPDENSPMGLDTKYTTDSSTHMDRDKVLEKARLSRPSLGLGLDSSSPAKLLKKAASAIELKIPRIKSISIE